jgi:hypothetical protein
MGANITLRILEDGNSLRVLVRRMAKGILGHDKRVESVGTSKHLIRTQVQQAELNTSYKHKFSRQN